MLWIVFRRILFSIPLLLIVTVLVFILQSFIPGNAAANLAGVTASPQQIAELRVKLGLDEPITVQYYRWLDGLFHGNLGNSLSNDERVTAALNTRLAVTLSLILAATIVSTVIGLIFGIVSSLGGRFAGAISDVVSIFGMAIPGFWLALLLISIFSVHLGWFPSNGYVRFSQSPGAWVRALVLPVIALSFSGITSIAKQTRQGMLEALNTDFVRTLRANGIKERSIVFKHALRNAALPVVTVSGLLFIGYIGGAVIVEQIFGLPGLGSLAVSATSSNDIPVIQGVTLYFTLIVVAINMLLDIIYGWLNPKARGK